MSLIKEETTDRGFKLVIFEDLYKEKCSIQQSSIATEHAIWFGIDKINPVILAGDAIRLGIKTDMVGGWEKYPIPKEVLLTSRMHLTQEQVKELLPYLQRFSETGEI